ncbi:hypothetical protein NA57DRAFT_81096 [Rhizodiscina lignyota]|uniref:Uncharacterized protein n=1 Tax=Rhizodiscina lignyota TaxID=1504668 RepID=A0A9P4M586_9PEZI|nr:hypothetical protein NA57DRAFT_81096 [Rhizodiscina lignyota]
MSLASATVITQSCDYTTWPDDQPTVPPPPQSIWTNFPGCQLCTVYSPDEADCSPLPSSLGCTPETTSTVLSADTVGVSVGTLTGSALFSAITSAMDRVCEVPASKGQSATTGSFTCDESAIATLSSNIVYKQPDEDVWDDKGSLTLQFTEASFDSLEWYETNKLVMALFTQNSTQRNCEKITAWGQSSTEHQKRHDIPPDHIRDTFTVCKAGSHFQLIEFDPSSKGATRELSFSLKFQADTQGDIQCHFLEDVLEFIETEFNVATDTEGYLPDEVKIDDKLLEECEGHFGRIRA